MSRKYDYDTAAIRAQARQIRSCRDKLTQTAEPRVRTIQNALNGRFVGLAADALNERMEETRREIQRLEGELNLLYAGLMRYVDALEEADRRVAQIMAE